MTVSEKSPSPAFFVCLMGAASLVSGLCGGLAASPFTEIWSPLVSPSFSHESILPFFGVQVGLQALEGGLLAFFLMRLRSSLERVFAFCVLGGLAALLLYFIEVRLTNDYLVRHAETWRLHWRWGEAAIRAARSLPPHLLLVAGAELLPSRAKTVARGLGLFLALGSVCGLAHASTLYQPTLFTFGVVVGVSVLHFALFYVALRRRPAPPAPPPGNEDPRDLVAESHLRALALSFLLSTLVGAGLLLWSIHDYYAWRGSYWPISLQVLDAWPRRSFVALATLTFGWVGWLLWRQSNAGRALAVLGALTLAVAQIRWLFEHHAYRAEEFALFSAGLIWTVAMLAFLLHPRAARVCSDAYRELQLSRPERPPSILRSGFLTLPIAGLSLYVLLTVGVEWAFG